MNKNAKKQKKKLLYLWTTIPLACLLYCTFLIFIAYLDAEQSMNLSSKDDCYTHYATEYCEEKGCTFDHISYYKGEVEGFVVTDSRLNYPLFIHFTEKETKICEKMED